jgi:hypothetical protein
MKNKIVFFLIFISVCVKADIIQDYLAKNYKKICNINNISKYKNNEKILSIIGVSCVKIDSLYLLPYIVNRLKHTPYGRKNSIYFLTIVMEKKLLYSFVFDNLSLKPFSFPLTDYVLSAVFEAIKNGNYKKDGDVYVINDKTEGIVYKVYKQDDKMYIDEYINNKLIKRRWYR